MLVSALRKDFEVKVDIGKNIFDKALLYINPEIWVKEKAASGELPLGKYDKVNNEFKQIQAYGRATGIMPENTMIARALKQAADMKATISPSDRLILRGELNDLREFPGVNLPVHPATNADEVG